MSKLESAVRKNGFGGPLQHSTSARRLRSVQNERTLIRMWRAAPEAVSFLRDVVRGAVPYDEGKFKCAQAILSRCVPTITAQQLDATHVTTNVSASDLLDHLRKRLDAITPTATGDIH